MGRDELLVREGLANRNRDKLLRSVKFGALRDRAGGSRGGRSGSSQRAALVVAHSLLDFLPRVHYERSVLHHRLV